MRLVNGYPVYMTTPRKRQPARPVVPDLAGFLTATDVGRMLNVTTERVRQLAARPHDPIPSVATPLGRLFWPSDVAAWQAGREARGYVAPSAESRGRRPTHNATVHNLNHA